jgi:uncharacterized protein YifN (PemK superfamily)
VSLNFHPGQGVIVFCDFGHGGPFQPPEMMKGRPVVVISPRRRTSQLVTVIPLSGTPPRAAQPWHHPLSLGAYPPARAPMWAKCDMVAAVALGRLALIKQGRQFQSYQMPPTDLAGILAAVKAALGMR